MIFSPLNKLAGAVAAMAACFAAAGCTSYYSHLKPATGSADCIKAFAPQFSNTLYTAYIDVTTHHLSGLLFFKKMPDSSMRVVFTNEVGVKFFDFGFDRDGAFTKYYTIAQMDKKIVVNALRHDLELVLMQQDMTHAATLHDSAYTYTAIPSKKGRIYYITDHCETLVRIEKSSKRKPVVIAHMLDYTGGVPDSIAIQHQNFKFNIMLKRALRPTGQEE